MTDQVAPTRPGPGCAALSDRVEALGGTLIVADAEPHGTLVELRL